jgi:hypothetical protein
MILGCIRYCYDPFQEYAYQRFVKTTPKPRATKNSSGLLPDVLFCDPGAFDPGVFEAVGLAALDVAAETILLIVEDMAVVVLANS